MSLVPRGNLPPASSSFVGRRRELCDVQRQLGRSRLVTITGVGGVGKTRLALQLARKVARAYPAGVWLVTLAELRDGDLLPQHVARSLGITDMSGLPPAEFLADFLADRRLLLVLDNCEHLRAPAAALARRLLETATELQILATSREPLSVVGEAQYRLYPLPIGDADDHGEDSDAVRLLLTRAVDVDADFRIDDRVRKLAAQVCRRVDGIPLAIELVVGWLGPLRLEEILDYLTGRPSLVTRDDRVGRPPRHQTLRAAIDWSHDLCTPAEQILWRRLSVFAGGFTARAAEEVCTDDGIDRQDVIELVVGLFSKSLIRRADTTRERVARYQMLETIRQYGAEQLAVSGETERMRERHRDHYLVLAQQADAAWSTVQQVDWIHTLHAEAPNIAAALDYSLATGQTETALTTAASLCRWWIATDIPTGRHWLEQVLRHHHTPTAIRARALCHHGFMAEILGEDAATLIPRYRELAARVGDPVAIAYADQYAGVAALHRQDYQTAVTLLEKALSAHHSRNDEPAFATTTSMLVQALIHLGDLPRAQDIANESRRLTTAAGARWSESWSAWTQGLAAWGAEDHEQAIALIREAIAIKWECGDLLGTALATEGLAYVTASGPGPAEEAALLLGAAYMLWELLGSPLIRFGHFQYLRHRCEQTLLDALGEETFAAMHVAGAGWSAEHAVAYATGAREAALRPASRHERDRLAPLTPREREVARLVAKGMTNQEIASTHVVSKRTVDSHVEHILTKLGFTTRLQIAEWFRQRDLVLPDLTPEHPCAPASEGPPPASSPKRTRRRAVAPCSRQGIHSTQGVPDFWFSRQVTEGYYRRAKCCCRELTNCCAIFGAVVSAESVSARSTPLVGSARL